MTFCNLHYRQEKISILKRVKSMRLFFIADKINPVLQIEITVAHPAFPPSNNALDVTQILITFPRCQK